MSSNYWLMRRKKRKLALKAKLIDQIAELAKGIARRRAFKRSIKRRIK